MAFNFVSMQKKSLTADEAKHYRYGMNILNLNSDRLILPSGAVDDSKMPVTALNALPARLAEDLPEGGLRSLLMKFQAARFVTVLFSACIAWLVFVWARDLYGFIPGLASLFLYVFDPNLIAHSQLITTDIYATGMILLSSYWLWKFARTCSRRDGLAFAVCLGVAQLAKYTAFSLYPLLAIAFLAHDWPRLKQVLRSERWRGLRREAGKYFAYPLVVLAVSLVVVNIGFLFNRTFTPLKDYPFKSELFQGLQTKLAFVGGLPIPTPYPYFEGLDWITFKERTGVGFGRVYLLGETRYGQGFPGYYFVASLLKVPIATQVILLAALVVYFSRRPRTFWKDELFLLWLVLFYAIYFNFLYNAQIGIRFYLVIFPLLYVFAGSLFVNWRSFSWAQRAVPAALALYLAASVLSQYPHYLAYFNEIVWDRKMAYLYLADSNIEWGQDFNYLKAYRDQHPKVDAVPEVPHRLQRPRTFFVSVNHLVGVYYFPSTYRWLRENFKPVGMIAPSYLLYEITPGQMQALCDTTDYCK